MKSNLSLSCSFVALLFVLRACSSSGAFSPLLMASGATDSDKTGYYIVVVNDSTTPEKFKAIKSQVLSMTEDGELHGSVEKLIKAFTVKLSDRALSTVRSLPEVEFVEEETMAHGAQDNNVIWHVDRLDQYYLPLDNSYETNGTGDGVDIYIFDTGVNYNHEEFEGRAEYGGYDPTDVANNETLRGNDCFGHGTHVASLAAGKKYGTAKKARIYSIRVLGCNNIGRWTTVIDGLDYVSSIIPLRGRPAVVSMSLYGGYSQTVDNAIKTLYNKGVIIVTIAGNDGGNACNISPGSSPTVITVAASTIDDEIYNLTNVGPCVDIFAPGSAIRAADHRCASCSSRWSGTSMAAPKVSGAAAIHLEKDPTLSPDQMKKILIATATTDVLNFAVLPTYYRLSTPNHLLYIGFGKCQKLPNITNGNITGHLGNRTVGTIATYTCIDGYALVGSMQRICQSNGTWSGPKPSCVRMPPAPEVQALCSVVVWYSPEMLTCSNITGYDVRFYTQSPQQELTRRVESNGTFYIITDEDSLGKSDETYVQVRVVSVDVVGKWSEGISLGCDKHTASPEPPIGKCQKLPNITNGNITGHLGNRTVGTIANYTCIDGYVLVGSMQRTCQSNGTWSGLKPSCVRMPPAPEVRGLCSIVVWYSPEMPNYSNITGYDVRLYTQSPQQQLTRRVGSNGTFYIITDEDSLGKSDKTYVQVRVVSVDVAGKWSEGISLGCDMHTVAPEPPSNASVYFELNNKIYHNNSAVCITAIGVAGSALYCKTNKEDCCKTVPNRYGEFYYPNGTQVPIVSRQDGFYRDRDEQLIRLNRREGTFSPTGKYRCEIPDTSGEMKNIYVVLT